MGAICSTTVPVGTRLLWSTDSRPVRVGWDGMASVVDGKSSMAGRTKINWTKHAHNTRICMHTRTPQPYANTHTHTRCVVMGWAVGLLKTLAHDGRDIGHFSTGNNSNNWQVTTANDWQFTRVWRLIPVLQFLYSLSSQNSATKSCPPAGPTEQ